MEFEDDCDEIVLSELIEQIPSGNNLMNNTELTAGVQVEIKEEPPVEIIDALEDDSILDESKTTDHQKVKLGREKRNQYMKEYPRTICNTPVQNAAKLAARREQYRKKIQNETAEERSRRKQYVRRNYVNRLIRREQETPEQHEQRLKQHRERSVEIGALDRYTARLAARREQYHKKIQNETAEERLIRQQRLAVQRERYRKMIENQTAEERSRRQQYVRRNNAKRLIRKGETPEQHEQRLKHQEIVSMAARKRRFQNETAEQRSRRLKYFQRLRLIKRETETPEQREQRLKRQRECYAIRGTLDQYSAARKEYNRKKIQNETAEQREQRLKRYRERYALDEYAAARKEYNRKKIQNETAEQRSRRLQRSRQTYANKIIEEGGETVDQRKRRLGKQEENIAAFVIRMNQKPDEQPREYYVKVTIMNEEPQSHHTDKINKKPTVKINKKPTVKINNKPTVTKPTTINAESAEEREWRLRRYRQYYGNVEKNRRRSNLINETDEEREIRLKKQRAYYLEKVKPKKDVKRQEKHQSNTNNEKINDKDRMNEGQQDKEQCK